MLTPEQFSQVMALLTKIAEQPHTITSMHDWPMLTAMVGMFGGVLLLIIGGCIGYLVHTMDKEGAENRAEHQMLWQAHKDCQDDCCPRSHGQEEKK